MRRKGVNLFMCSRFNVRLRIEKHNHAHYLNIAHYLNTAQLFKFFINNLINYVNYGSCTTFLTLEARSAQAQHLGGER